VNVGIKKQGKKTPQTKTPAPSYTKSGELLHFFISIWNTAE